MRDEDFLTGKKEFDPYKTLANVGFSYKHRPFSMTFRSTTSQGEKLISTMDRTLVMFDKYLEIGFHINSQKLFGAGEHKSAFLLKPGLYSIFARDQEGTPVAKGDGRTPLYGAHPFIMFQSRESGDFAALYFFNSNAQQFSVTFLEDGTSIVNYVTTGGVLDFFVLTHGNAKSIMRAYFDLIGRPLLPPFWALGFHQCSF